MKATRHVASRGGPAVDTHSLGSAVGGAIRTARKSAGLTQEQLAYRAGISFTTVNQIENGRTNPYWDTVVVIADVLGVSLDTLRGSAAA